jgi:hypothetical protein
MVVPWKSGAIAVSVRIFFSPPNLRMYHLCVGPIISYKIIKQGERERERKKNGEHTVGQESKWQ